jgi:hypothetical protein
MKNLHFLGAQDFQILSTGSKQTAPWKRAAYADLAEYCPVKENLQMCVRNTMLKGNLFYLLEQHHELQDHRY